MTGGSLRVLHVIDDLVAGGAQTLLATLVRELHVGGLATSTVIAVSTRADPGVAAAFEGAAPVIRTGLSLRDPRLVPVLARLVTRVGADLVHSHLAVANVSSRLGARLARRPHVTTVHTMPGPLREDSPRLAAADTVTARLSALVVAPSAAMADAYSSAWGLPPGRFRVIPNPSPPPWTGELDRARVRAELAPGAEHVVVCVARLQRQKGLDDLVEAAATLPPATRVLVAGDGPERERIERSLARRGVSHVVRLLGHRPDVARLLACADAFVLPSRHEGLPISLLEAMDAGVPCVATAVGGVPELLDGGRAGLLVPPSRPDALARALTRLLLEESLAHQLAVAAQSRVAQSYSRTTAARRHAGVYRELARPRCPESRTPSGG